MQKKDPKILNITFELCHTPCMEHCASVINKVFIHAFVRCIPILPMLDIVRIIYYSRFAYNQKGQNFKGKTKAHCMY